MKDISSFRRQIYLIKYNIETLNVISNSFNGTHKKNQTQKRDKFFEFILLNCMWSFIQWSFVRKNSWVNRRKSILIYIFCLCTYVQSDECTKLKKMHNKMYTEEHVSYERRLWSVSKLKFQIILMCFRTKKKLSTCNSVAMYIRKQDFALHTFSHDKFSFSLCVCNILFERG